MMERIPLVSVVVSAFNVENYIEDAIGSLLHQTYRNIEIVIADDGSSDATRKLIDSFDDPRIKRFHNERNLGLLTTWNMLLSRTKGDYITFQDGDDRSMPDRVQRLVEFLETNPDVGLCGTNFIRYFERWGLYQESNYPLTDEDIRVSFKAGVVPFNGTRVMVRREVYLAVGGFRDFFKGLAAEDFDWILRIAEKCRVANIPDVLYEYRYFMRSASKNSLTSPVERIFVGKIIFFLADQRSRGMGDALDRGAPEEIYEFLKPFREQLENDKSNYIRFNRVFGNLLSNKDYGGAWALLRDRLVRHPMDLKNNVVGLGRICFGFFRTVSKSIVVLISGRTRYSSLNS